jgi:glutathione synthase/RimK-type ligase-like ATP-grasp enzyme
MSSTTFDLIRQKTILFLTTKEYSHAPSISDPYSEPANIASLPVQNKALAETLALAGADVRFSSWKFPAAASTRATLCRFDIILFLCCDGYAQHMEDFLRFLDQTLIPLQEVLPRLRVVNDPRVVRWNAAKEYLRELQDARFRVCRTKFLQRAGCGLEGLKRAVEEFVAGGARMPVVLKPSVGASGNSVHLVRDPTAFTTEDLERMEAMLGLPGTVGSIMIQEFQATVGTVGEYSLVYVGGVFSHAAVKRPKAGGAEWKVDSQYGGGVVEIGKEDLPTGATEVGERLCEWLRKKFGEGSVGYMRLDGVLAEDDGGFVIGEVELIEPEIWLAKDQQRVERFVMCLLEEGKPQAA